MRKRMQVINILFMAIVLIVWSVLSHLQAYRSDLFPYAQDFLQALRTELTSGRLVEDVGASLYRWLCGFILSAAVGIPVGLWLGQSPRARAVLAPYLNFFRSLSPLAWIPFAVIWFGIGDAPVVFLIFLGTVFPILFATMNAVFQIPKVFHQVAREYHFSRIEYMTEILFPAVLPQIVSSLRLVAALAWIVLVPSEMLAGKEGLGFAILDARNGMRTDLLVVNMAVIGLLAHATDILLQRLNQMAHVRWSYEH